MWPRRWSLDWSLHRQTIYVKLADGKTVEDAKASLEAAYEGERFVTVLPGAAVPHTRHVRGRCVHAPRLLSNESCDKCLVVELLCIMCSPVTVGV